MSLFERVFNGEFIRFHKLRKYFEELDENDIYLNMHYFVEFAAPEDKMCMKIFVDRYLISYMYNWNEEIRRTEANEENYVDDNEDEDDNYVDDNETEIYEDEAQEENI